MSSQTLSDDENISGFGLDSDFSPQRSNFTDFGVSERPMEADPAKKSESASRGRRNSAPVIPVYAPMPKAGSVTNSGRPRRKSWCAGSVNDEPSEIGLRRGNPKLSLLTPQIDIEDAQSDQIVTWFDSQLKKLEDNVLTMLLAVSLILLAFLWGKMPVGGLQNCLAGFAVACLSMQGLTTSQLLTVSKDSKKGYASHALVVLGGLVVAIACAIDGARHALDIFSHEMRLFLLIGILYLTFAASNMMSIRWGRGLVKTLGADLKESKLQSAPLLAVSRAYTRVLHRTRAMFGVAVLLVATFLGYVLLHTYPDLHMWQGFCCMGQLCAALVAWQLEQELMVGASNDADDWQATLDMMMTPALVVGVFLLNFVGFYWQAHLVFTPGGPGHFFHAQLIDGQTMARDYAHNVWLRWTTCFGTLCLVDAVGGLSRLCRQMHSSDSFIKEITGELPKSP